MSEAPHDIIPEFEINRVHAHANFGDLSKRSVVDEGVLKYAFGYTGGHTQLSILLDHRLIRKPAPGSYRSTLTEKGRRYLRAVYGEQFNKIAALAKARAAS